MIMSGSSSSSMGGGWTSQLWFYTKDGVVRANHNSLRERVGEEAGITNSEKIKNIYIYKRPLSTSSEIVNPLSLVHHWFVVIETNNWHCSIEKNSEKILLQRFKKKQFVEKYEKGNDRNTPVEIMVGEKGKGSMKDLINFIYDGNELEKPYIMSSDNCQSFAQRLFDEFKMPNSDTESPNSTMSQIICLSLFLVSLYALNRIIW